MTNRAKNKIGHMIEELQLRIGEQSVLIDLQDKEIKKSEQLIKELRAENEKLRSGRQKDMAALLSEAKAVIAELRRQVELLSSQQAVTYDRGHERPEPDGVPEILDEWINGAKGEGK